MKNSDALISPLAVLAPPDHISDQDEDDEGCKHDAHHDGHDVVMLIVAILWNLGKRQET